MISIRPALASDEAVIIQMIHAEQLDPTSLNWRNFLMAVDEAADNQIVGIGQIKILRGAYELGSLVVVEGYRGRGIAGNLIRALQARAPRPLYLLCETKMCSYYAKFGLRRISFWHAPLIMEVKWLIPSTIFFLAGYRFALMVQLE